MRRVDLKTAHLPQGQEDRVARLVRHLDARLKDFGPGGPEVLESDQSQGFVSARFPGHDTKSVLKLLEKDHGVVAALDGDRVIFFLSPDIRFEDLDYVWGCLFDLL